MYNQDSLKASSYEGWVAWIDGSPVINPTTQGIMGYDGCTALFERVKEDYKLQSLVYGGKTLETRVEDRQTIDWKELPHHRVRVLELYAFRDLYPNQPLIQISAQPNHDIRWIQYKRGGLVLHTHGDSGQQRLGISSWVMGYWDRTAGQAELWDYPARGGKVEKKDFSGSNHPCWPRPLGFGLSPAVLGLKDSEVPQVPVEITL